MDIKEIIELFTEHTELSEKDINLLEEVLMEINEEMTINDLFREEEESNTESIRKPNSSNLNLDWNKIDFNLYSCPTCTKAFNSRTALDAHFKIYESHDPDSQISNENKAHYYDEKWLEIQPGVYETWVRVDSDKKCTVNISISNNHLLISEPIDQKIPISHLPHNVNTVEAEVDSNIITIRVKEKI